MRGLKSNLEIIPSLSKLSKDRRNKKRSYDRSLKKVVEYIFANEFELLMTITFDPRLLRNYTPFQASRYVQRWLYTQTLNSRRADKELKYIVFPDISEDKHLLEFHILVSGYAFSLKRSGIIVDGTLAYTIKGFRFGFTKARSLTHTDKQSVLDTVLPYLDNNCYELFNGRRYWPSRSLDEIHVLENNITRLEASYDLDAINALGVVESVG